MFKDKVLGGVLIIAGTTIGGGMLALPIVSAFSGFNVSMCVLIAMWALMSYTALVTLEINLFFKKGVSISYAAEYAFGRLGSYVSSAAITVLFYALLSAYMSASTSIINHTLNNFNVAAPQFITLGLFTLVFTGIITAQTAWVDKSSRALLLVKTVAFVLIALLILPNITISYLQHTPNAAYTNLTLLIPLFFTSFGFHGSISSVVNYIGLDSKKLRFTFLLGSLIPLGVYIIWEIIALGTVPLSGPKGFIEIQQAGGDLGTFTETLSALSGGGGWVISLSHIFTFLAIVTSFLGVGLGLYHFMEEQLEKHTHKKPKTISVWLLTFVLPIIFALFFPQGFVVALGYAAIALSTLAVIMPTLIALKLRPQYPSKSYQVAGGTFCLLLALLGGVAVILLELISV
jgi:tyrosine-specific transport protein